ncbi:MAG TPA: 2OG-Fe(II) oxygenase [Rhizomicrobium sp.]
MPLAFAMPPRVRILPSQTVIDSDPQADALAAALFAERHMLELPGLLGDDLPALFAQMRRNARFVPDGDAKVGQRLLEEPPRLGTALCFLLKRQPLRAWLEQITGIGPLVTVGGATAQFLAGGGHQLEWHNDLVADQARLLGVTVNLGSEPYEGGRFELRRRKETALLAHYDHRQFGSALMFRVSRDLMHRVTPVTEGGPRTVFGGWFFGEAPA